jgi:hypothetical protein
MQEHPSLLSCEGTKPFATRYKFCKDIKNQKEKQTAETPEAKFDVTRMKCTDVQEYENHLRQLYKMSVHKKRQRFCFQVQDI